MLLYSVHGCKLTYLFYAFIYELRYLLLLFLNAKYVKKHFFVLYNFYYIYIYMKSLVIF